MSDVKRVTLTTISDVVRKGAGAGASIGGPFGALDGANAMSSALGGGGAAFAAGGSHSPAVKESSAAGSGVPGPEGGKSGSAKKHKTVRLELNLFEPTAESFPEFNFSKLVHEEQKRLKKAQKKHHDDSNNGFLSDPELDNDVARMARELERKYGSGTAYASKDKYARPAKLDYYDRGAGYDEEDSFIDNSEAYDELIPQEIETVGGGFYINSGQLEFKQLSNFERPDDVHRMPKPKKRALSTTSESSDDDEPPANAKKKAEERGQPPVAPPSQTPAQSSSEKTASTNTEKPLQQQQLTEEERANSAGNSGTEVVTITTTSGDERPRVNGHVAKKQKLADNGPLGAPKGGVEKDKAKSSTVSKTTMEEPGKEKSNGVKAKVSTINTQPTVVGAGPTVALGTGGGKKDENENDGGVKLIKTTTVKDMLRAKRDSLRKMEQEKKGRSSGSSRVSSSEAEEDGEGGGDDDDEDEENDEDDDEDDEEDDEDEEMGEGSEKESNESGSEEDIGSESESSHAESASEKDAAARAKLVPATNGTGGEGERPVTVVPTEQQQQQKDKEKERKRKESKLPDELPESLRKVVETLKELAQTHAIGGKLNYFDSKVAEVLLQVDEGARVAGNSTRNAIFRHLEAQLSISRQSLQLKIKKIRIRKLEGRAKAVLDQLEDTICDQMPLLLAKHELDCRKVAEQRAAQAAAAAQTAGTNVLPLGSTDPTTANGEKPGPQTTNATSTANTPQIRNPKKKYSWNERTRDLLWELYSIRVESFTLVRPRNETEDDFVAEYLRNKVVPLWPKGWMRYEDLHKELDRRKKALAKSAPAAAAAVVAAAVPKKHPMVVLPPLTSPPSTAVDSTWMTASGTPTATAMNGSTKASGSPSVIGGAGKCTGSPGVTAGGTPLTPQVPPSNLSPNGVSNKRGGSSDHSISNIMNSPPLPPPAGEKHSTANRSQPTGRRSFDDDQLMLSPPNPAGGSLMERDGSSAKRGLLVSPPDHRTGSLPVADRQRWNSREDDSDSSIEIIGEYNVIGGGAGGGGHGPTASAGVIHSAKSIIPATPPTPASTTNVLPVLNKEKYKNLIAGKNKGHGSGGGSSPVGSADTSPTGGALIGPGKYSKHSPTVAGERMMTPQQGTGGGSLFSTPSGGSTGGGGGGVGGGGGGIRLSDVSRMKESPSTSSSIDLDVHQIMKDLKEYQELQQHHSAGGSRKADATTIPSQQQHVQVPLAPFLPRS